LTESAISDTDLSSTGFSDTVKIHTTNTIYTNTVNTNTRYTNIDRCPVPEPDGDGKSAGVFIGKRRNRDREQGTVSERGRRTQNRQDCELFKRVLTMGFLYDTIKLRSSKIFRNATRARHIIVWATSANKIHVHVNDIAQTRIVGVCAFFLSVPVETGRM